MRRHLPAVEARKEEPMVQENQRSFRPLECRWLLSEAGLTRIWVARGGSAERIGSQGEDVEDEQRKVA